MTTSTNCVQMKAKYYHHRLCLMKHNLHYLNALCHFGPCNVYAYDPKLDISCTLDISHNISTQLYENQAEVLLHQPFYQSFF